MDSFERHAQGINHMEVKLEILFRHRQRLIIGVRSDRQEIRMLRQKILNHEQECRRLVENFNRATWDCEELERRRRRR